MPKGKPAAGKRQIDPANKPGPEPKLPEGTYTRSYRATRAEHEQLTAHLAQIRAATEGDKEREGR